jgi:hypothetical protein
VKKRSLVVEMITAAPSREDSTKTTGTRAAESGETTGQRGERETKDGEGGPAEERKKE